MDRQTSPSPMAAESDAPYVPHDVFDETANTALIGLGSGLFIAAIRNAMSKRNVGAMSVFTRGAPIIGICTAGPAAYAFFSRTAMNLREKDDAWAAAFGGFMCGAILGLPSRKMPVVLGLGALVLSVQGPLYYLGGRIDSYKKEDDEFERKEIIRRTTRVPIEQTIAEIGEGRGIKPPGYEERRRERIKEKYGFEIKPVKATVDGSQ
ncbi:tim17/Tim22/Tim23/Pmp24 family protein [Hirsutella rhossiliensis]|uniref:Tim17/Tim22/Tim23/Pmp24 family domain-containing protein n=1 Tax=Hirsutella rhossiliensis TaxID=111463 RepID=A0A9P8MN23_9HYPO|nr:tim17/Tim22/Tim23/Pmp24 family domain-containing protein [Hirsutella rhossiliensis]KAH0958029.1 tim17/Tim22/Tim23/Pmp24 family domain-containing protein [Hirsutella rhossiliensis]